MRVSILFTSHPDAATEPYPHHAVHARVTREVMQAEEEGFDAIWIAEHHFSNTYGILPDPFSYLAYLAAKTTRIKLGAAVMVVPLHHPMRIVENSAFIDILSNGRFQLGLGTGYRKYEFDGLGVDYEARREIQAEAIPIILDGFHKRKLNHQGKYFTIKVDGKEEIFPQPVQSPHPPFYLGAGTPGTIIQAATHGFGMMMGSLPSGEILANNVKLYRENMHLAPPPLNKNPAFGEVDVVRMVYVAPTDAQAREESEAGIVRHMSSFLGGDTKGYLGEVAKKNSDSQFSYESLCSQTILHGSPETVIRGIERLAAIGVTSLMIHYPPYYGPERISAMLRLFAKEVLPAVREIGQRPVVSAAALATSAS